MTKYSHVIKSKNAKIWIENKIVYALYAIIYQAYAKLLFVGHSLTKHEEWFKQNRGKNLRSLFKPMTIFFLF